TPTPTPTPAPQQLTLTISGDLLWHRGLLADGAAAGKASGRAYDFEPIFEHIRPLLGEADLSICHIEVPVAPEGVKPVGYPVFAAPPETIEAAAAVGFDYCTFASNHTFDQGWAGVEATLDALEDHGIVHAGAFRTEADAGRPNLWTSPEGVKVAVVAGSYGSNLKGPADKPWALGRLDADTLIERGRAAREAGADLVLAAMHAGTEQQHRPNDQQVKLATSLAESGVFDLVYGHHAHVPQPWDKINDTWVVYGGGNLVGQMKVATPRAYEQYLGRLTFEKTGEGWEAVRAEYVPLMVTLSRPGAPARVLDVNKALAEGTGDAARLRVAKEQVASAVGLLGVEGVAEVG
ncbi:MAG: CapA family protein, partial [Propionibacteriaceae bacterium]|nr:CapA family protein [Propionibacteriaceae bacterium]